MIISQEVENMCPVAQGVHHGAAPVPTEGKWVKNKEVKDISGLTHHSGLHPLCLTGDFHLQFLLPAEGPLGSQIWGGSRQGAPTAGDRGIGQTAVIGPDVSGVHLPQSGFQGGEMGGGEKDFQLTIGKRAHVGSPFPARGVRRPRRLGNRC